MVTAQELGYKPNILILENDTFAELRPQMGADYQHTSPKYVLQRRLAELSSLPADRKWTKQDMAQLGWNINPFFVNMGAFGTETQVGLVPDSKALRGITADTPLSDGGIEHDAVPAGAKVYDRAQVEQFLDRDLNEDDVLNPENLWVDGIAGGDNKLMEALVPHTFKALKDVYGLKTGMGVYFPKDVTINQRALVLDRVNDRADALGNNDLDDYYARIVGVRGEVAPEGRAPQDIRAYTPADVEAARSELTRLHQLSEVGRCINAEDIGLLKSLESLLVKL